MTSLLHGWFSPLDGRYTPVPLLQAWLRLKVQQHTAVDLRLLEAMGRVVPVQLLARPMSRGATTRRRALAPVQTAAIGGA